MPYFTAHETLLSHMKEGERHHVHDLQLKMKHAKVASTRALLRNAIETGDVEKVSSSYYTLTEQGVKKSQEFNIPQP